MRNDNLTLAEKASGYRDALVQQAAGIIAQIENQAGPSLPRGA